MGCDKCGRPTPRARLCKTCGLHDHLDRRDDPEPEYYTCPSCGGTTSGPDADCYKCRGDDR